MKWRGETQEQQTKRLMSPHMRYAYIPNQMDCGAWVWLEHYWARMDIGANGREFWSVGLSSDDVAPRVLSRPPPPKPLRRLSQPPHEPQNSGN